ncbi:MAG: hypothetical protein S4CHLAM81_14510 [Chlamydiales bacterium]|nr:hypothetical protein [Chlamydiales bacterium]MCH9636223.1 hypothetical protein [Chlamydiales bacterium]MCH9703792.1 exopolysaccharide biosynthesis polyprenyl glycosylphosphotransferase [Chlamydiota bacterium]
MKKCTSLLFGIELSLIFASGLIVGVNLLWIFPAALFIYMMSGGMLFYKLIFDDMSKRRMRRKLTRRWLLLTALIGWLVPLWLITSFFALFTFRAWITSLFSTFKRRRWFQSRLAIVGSDQLADKLGRIYWSGYRIIALDPKVEDLEKLRIQELWLAFPISQQEKALPYLEALAHSTVNIKLIPDLTSVAPINLGASNIGSMIAIHLRDTPMQGINRMVKYLEDRVLAAGILLIASPVMLMAAIVVKLSSPGPIFYRQERLSWNNQPFWMLKFRTMPITAEAASGPVWASSSDSRTTFVGKWMRKLCIDELPQFWNVLRGEMSIVGPRPERPHFIRQFKEEVPCYMQKHMVKAGITGLAQIRGFRGQTDLSKRIDYDLQYIREWSLWLDLKIIAMTLIKGFKNAY